jgi:hypothetical protein
MIATPQPSRQWLAVTINLPSPFCGLSKNPGFSRHSRPRTALAHEAGANRTYMSKLEKGGSYIGLKIIGKLGR